MIKTKAAFKALREECGLSQLDIADEAGVSLSSVKKWENPKYEYNNPPDDVWGWLQHKRMELEAKAQESIETLLKLHKRNTPVGLAYYRSQEQLDFRQLERGLDESVGFVNALTRRCMQILREKHVNFDIYYPEEMNFVYTEPIGEDNDKSL